MDKYYRRVNTQCNKSAVASHWFSGQNKMNDSRRVKKLLSSAGERTGTVWEAVPVCAGTDLSLWCPCQQWQTGRPYGRGWWQSDLCMASVLADGGLSLACRCPCSSDCASPQGRLPLSGHHTCRLSALTVGVGV